MPDTHHAGSNSSRAQFAVVLACFVLSGFAALAYQIVWIRQFSIVFGTSELAVASVLSAYMAGLAVGAAAAGRFAARITRPLLAYGALELLVALGALAVPWGLDLAGRVLVAVLGGRPELPDSGGGLHALFYLAVAFAVVLVPTAAMGATLPLLARGVVRRDEEIGHRIAWLYSGNTLGAMAGTLVAAFGLVPALGLSRTVWVAIGTNGLVVLLAAWLSRAVREGASVFVPEASNPTPSPTAATENSARVARQPVPAAHELLPRAALVFPAMLVSGAIAFLYEILWTRLLGQILGGSLYAFATMLASVLAGIALGSAIATRFARTRRPAAVAWIVAQAATGLLSLGIWALLDELPGLAAFLGAGETASLGTNALLAGCVLLPATIAGGATYPLAVRLATPDVASTGSVAARVYAWNTVGAILGGIGAGFVIVPWFQFEGAIRLAVGTNLALAVGGWIAWQARSRRAVLAAVAGVAVIALLVRPQAPEVLLRHSTFRDEALAGERLFLRAGRSATVLLLEDDARYRILSNGLPEAAVARAGVPPVGSDPTHWLTLLPTAARPDARSLLVVGFGGGVALEALAPHWERVDVIELEPEIVEANRRIAALRARDPLADSRVRIVLNDARGALALTDRRWDVVVSQPSHPWTAGASHLYTREFAALVRTHLTDEGVFVQWMNSAFLEPAVFRTLAATLHGVFRNVRLYRPTSSMLLFVASDGPLDVERTWAEFAAQPESAAVREFVARRGLVAVEDLGTRLALDEEGLRDLVGDAPSCTDDVNPLATASIRTTAAAAARRGELEDELARRDPLSRLLCRSDPRGAPESGADPAPTEQPPSATNATPACCDRIAVARRLAGARPPRRAEALAESAANDAERAAIRAMIAQRAGDFVAADRFYEEVLRTDPAQPDALYFRLERGLPEGPDAPIDPARSALRDRAPESLRTTLDLWGTALRPATPTTWRELASHEEELARVPRAVPWWLAASLLRAENRLHDAYPATRSPAPSPREAAEEALTLLDATLVSEPDPPPVVLHSRIRAGLAAGRPEVAIETIAFLARNLRGREQAGGAAVRTEVRQTARALLRQLDQVRPEPPDGERRREAVRARLAALIGS